MLIGIKRLHGSALRARDGEIGSVDEVLFDDDHWTIRYFVVDTGGWLTGRKVLIPPTVLGTLDWDQRVLNVNLTREQVGSSPGVDTDAPVSRQWETEYHDHYAWPYYWGGMSQAGGFGMAGTTWNPGALLASAEGDERRMQEEADERARGHESARDWGDTHLRSTQEVTGYGVTATDGQLGHIDDFIVDVETWRIRYLVVDTHHWWPGKKVLLPLDWIGQVLWPDRIVTVGVTRDQVRNGPEWDSHSPISSAFEADLSAYYARQRVVAAESPVARTEAFAERAGHRH